MVIVIVVLISSGSFVTGNPQERVRILVVCSDVEDVMLANSLAVYGGFNVTVLYLGKDLPDDRSKLRDLPYLMGFDEVWIPDLNVQWTYGGRLYESEISTLASYVRDGGILVLGLNTYVQSWSRTFEKVTGTYSIRVEKWAQNGTWYILFNGTSYPYNASYQMLIVTPYRARVLANYSEGYPAVTISNYGRGVAAVLTFNPTREFVGYCPRIMNLYVAVARISLDERKGPPSLSRWELFWLWFLRLVSNPLFWGLLVFLVLELLAYLGCLPLGLTIVLAAPFHFLTGRLERRWPYRDVLAAVRASGGMEFSELAEALDVVRRRLKFPVALLTLSQRLNLINLAPLGGNDVLVVPRGHEEDGVTAWALKMYEKLLTKVAREPGISVIDLSMHSGMAPYDVLRLMRELSRYGVVEVPVPAGRHELTLRFEYPYRPLWVVSAATLLVVLLLLFLPRRRGG